MSPIVRPATACPVFASTATTRWPLRHRWTRHWAGHAAVTASFIECVTFRFRDHYFGDRMPYIPKEQLEAAMAADPVPRFRRQLVDDGICTDDELNGIDEGALISVEESLKAVLSAETPSADELDRDVYTPIRYPV